jgi:hypothetical protein
MMRTALDDAVETNWLFAIVAPSGENYYPAYYADPTLDCRILGRISEALGSLPASSKHYFFTTISAVLRETPLDALRSGREAEVLGLATRFARRRLRQKGYLQQDFMLRRPKLPAGV